MEPLAQLLGRGTKKKGGGLLTLINTKYAANSEELLDLSRSTADIEVQWIIIHREHCKDVVVGNVYRPPSGKLVKVIKYLNDCLGALNLTKVEVFIMGEMNVNCKNQTSNELKKLSFFMRSNGLTQLISSTTKNMDKTKSLLDLILTNSKYVNMSGTLSHYVSDHQPIYVVKKKKRDDRLDVEFQGRSYRNFDKAIFQERLLGCDSFYILVAVNQAWEFVLNQLMPILDDMCPIRTFRIKNYRPAWITAELIEHIKDRDYFYKKTKQDGSEDSWNVAKHLRNVTNSNISKAKRDFVLDKLNNSGNDCKRFWRVIKSVVPVI